MLDESTTTQPGETPAVTTPPAGETPAVATAGLVTITTATTDTEPFDAARAQRTIETQRESERAAKAAAKAAKDRADAAEARVKELESASMTEQQKRDQQEQERATRLTELERETTQHAAERRQFTLERAVWKLANHDDYQLIDPDAAVKLLDASMVQFSDDGALDTDSLHKALKALVKERPFLKRAAGSVQSGTTTNPSRTNGTTAPAETPDQRVDRLYRRGDSIFDTAKARAMGGGVVITEKQT